MAEFFEREKGKRWPRSQRFGLSIKGAATEATYREMIALARDGSGRRSFDAARAAWAAPLALDPGDGLYLGELQNGPRTLEEMVVLLEPCDASRREIKAAIDRLTDLGMIDALPAAERS